MPWPKGVTSEKARCSDEEFVSLLRKVGPSETARRLKISRRAVQFRLARCEERYNLPLKNIHPQGKPDGRTVQKRQEAIRENNRARILWNIPDGIVIIGSDAHYWPGYVTTAHKAFVYLCRELKPAAVILNGDMLDGSAISRWPRIGWEHRPSVRQELDVVNERLTEIEDAAPKAKKAWPLGNHDSRYELRLANEVPEFEGVKGLTLKEHFPAWLPCWSVWINDDTIVKHRYKGGIHATRNNTMVAGKSIVTGHLHSLKVTPFSDYNGTRWGVDTGTMADEYGPQFEGYMEDHPRDWRSGFVVLRFYKGKLLWPSVVSIRRDLGEEGLIEFEGKLIRV